jgi:hypothetical protein
VPDTVIDRDYPGSRPRGGGSLHPTTTHYNGIMCTGYNGCVGRYAIWYVLAISCFEGSSTPAYKGAWRGHHGGSGADTIWSPRLSPIQYLVLHGKSAIGTSWGICHKLLLSGNLPWHRYVWESAMAWLRGICHGMTAFNPPYHQQLGRPVGYPPYHLHGPPWFVGMRLRHWYTHLVYPQQHSHP